MNELRVVGGEMLELSNIAAAVGQSPALTAIFGAALICMFLSVAFSFFVRIPNPCVVSLGLAPLIIFGGLYALNPPQVSHIPIIMAILVFSVLAIPSYLFSFCLFVESCG
ncbi:MAG: hypothetical protein IT536_11680 [Hyphomicrobiales bacterium]|nr:hypothetical protein [Hyphomicrobiales bacterium]